MKPRRAPERTSGGGRSNRPSRAASASRVSPARLWAFRRVARLAQLYPELPIERAEPAGIEPRDAALAHLLVETIIRRWLTLRYALDWAAQGRWDRLEPRVQSALLVGSAQLLFFDRIPRSAAVNESVAWIKHASRPGAGGLVNAVLRRLSDAVEPERRAGCALERDELPIEDGRAVVVREGLALPADPLERISAACSLPTALLRAWMRPFGAEQTRKLALHSLVRAPVILNTTHAASPVASARIEPHATAGFHVFHGEGAGLTSLLASRRDIWAQDPASAMAVALAKELAPGAIADVCAGRGTKTRQLRAMFPEARIIATDIADHRRAELARVFAGDERTRVVKPTELIDFAGEVDLVLVDAPCSNTGVLGRRLEARHRFSDESIEQLTAVQRQILADSVRLLSPSGAILYSTCSLDERENQQQAQWLRRWHSLEPTRETIHMPAGLPGDLPARYTDGSYAVLAR